MNPIVQSSSAQFKHRALSSLRLWILATSLIVLGAALAREQPVPQPPGSAIRVVVLSDFNESYGSTRYSPQVDGAVTRTVSLKPDLVISTGDMVAGQRLSPPLQRPDIEAMWDAFHARVTTPLAAARLPFAVTPGNHDASTGERFRLEREIYREQWQARKPALDFVDAERFPFQYAFRLGDVLFISIDATSVGHLSHAQKQWLQALLQSEGLRVRHRVVFSHLPLWPFAVGRETDFLGDRELEAILRRGRVDLYLSGHHHAYYPGFKDGVRHVSQGCLGAAPRPLIGTGERPPRTMTVLDFDADGSIRVEAYAGPEFSVPVPRSGLPPQIASRWATIVRDDLAGQATVAPHATSR